MSFVFKKQPLFGYFFIPILTCIIVSSFLCSLAYAMVIKEKKDTDINHVICHVNILICISVILIIVCVIINIYICLERYDKPYKLLV